LEFFRILFPYFHYFFFFLKKKTNIGFRDLASITQVNVKLRDLVYKYDNILWRNALNKIKRKGAKVEKGEVRKQTNKQNMNEHSTNKTKHF